jgi:hypothetical protein
MENKRPVGRPRKIKDASQSMPSSEEDEESKTS